MSQPADCGCGTLVSDVGNLHSSAVVLLHISIVTLAAWIVVADTSPWRSGRLYRTGGDTGMHKSEP